MSSFILGVVAFIAGFLVAKKITNRSAYSSPPTKVTPSAPPPVTPKSYTPPRKFRDSRWEERDALFQGMVDEGVYLEGKEWLITRSEKNYFDNLEEWFGQYCHIHCQVSLGRLINFPEQPGFSEEERKRFFAIYNGMAMDYVLVSRKNNKIICVIELDDPSHERADRVMRDRWLNEIMSIAGIPFLRASVTQPDVKPPVWQTRDEIRPLHPHTHSETLH